MLVVAHGDDADLVAVFLAEQRAGAGRDGVVHRHQPRGDGGILQHDIVGDVLDTLKLFAADRLGVGDVEAQPFRRHQRTLLRHVIAQHLAQRLVQQVSGGVVGADGGAAGMVHVERERQAGLERAFLDHAGVDKNIAGLLLRVGDAEAHAIAGHHAGIADLAAGFAVERGLVQHNRAGIAGAERRDLLAVAHQRGDDAFGALGLVAEKLGGADLFAQRRTKRFRSRPRPSPPMRRARVTRWRSMAALNAV